MLKYEELREAFSNKKQGLKITVANLREKTVRDIAVDAKSRIEHRIDENRAEDQIKRKSHGPLELEYTNNWRERTNRLNDDGRLEFECYFKRIKGQGGEFYVLNLRTANMVEGVSEQQDQSEEPEEVDEEEQTTEDEDEEIPDQLPSELTLTVEDDEGMMERFNLSLTPDSESDEEDGDEEDEEMWDKPRKPDAVDELYLDICEVYADNPSEAQEDVYVPFQHPVARDIFEVSDLDDAEEVVVDTIHRLDERTIESILEEADADDDLATE